MAFNVLPLAEGRGNEPCSKRLLCRGLLFFAILPFAIFLAGQSISFITCHNPATDQPVQLKRNIPVVFALCV